MSDDSGPSRAGLVAAVVAVLVLGFVGLRVAVHSDEDKGRPNSVSNCDTPPALR